MHMRAHMHAHTHTHTHITSTSLAHTSAALHTDCAAHIILKQEVAMQVEQRVGLIMKSLIAFFVR